MCLIIFCVCFGISYGFQPFFSNANSVVFMSPNGTDKTACGSSISSACKTVAYAYKQNSGDSSKDILLGEGSYSETASVTINGTLNLLGQSPTNTVLKKVRNGNFVLFTLIANNSNLTIQDITLLLTNHTVENNYISSAGVNSSVSIALIQCRITMDLEDGLLNISGGSFYINNSKASLSISSCVFFNITTGAEANGRVITAERMSRFSIIDSSFINVQRSKDCPCFYLGSETVSITLLRCLFSLCKGNNSGVGYVNCITESSIIQSCSFWNITADSAIGALYIKSSMAYNASLSIINTTCLGCYHHNQGVICLADHLTCRITRCNFIECVCNDGGSGGCGNSVGGGALYVMNSCSVTVTNCSFISCRAGVGSAMIAVSSTITMSGCLFRGNHNVVYENDIWRELIPSCKPDVYGTVTNTPFNNDSCITAENDPCPAPCAALDTTMVCSQSCPDDYLAISGLCVPRCSFWKPVSEINETTASPFSVCPFPCVEDTSLGYNLCMGVGKCSAYPADHTMLLAGACKLRPCEQRIPLALDASEPCSDNSHCFTDTDLGTETDTDTARCVESCSAPNHYEGNTTTGRCALKTCSARLPIVSLSLPCASSDCFYDNVSTSQPCAFACSVSSHYEENTETGRCALKTCSARTLNASSKFPCGSSDCLYDPAASSSSECGDGCSVPSHFVENSTTGSCTLKTCSARVLNTDTTYPCGSNDDCFYDNATQSCASPCSMPSHWGGNATSGYCSLKQCGARVLNVSAAMPCGSDCFYDPASLKCVQACSVPGHFKENTTTGYCEILDCPDRIVVAVMDGDGDTPSGFPCGSETCYADPGGGGEGSQQQQRCVEHCSVPSHYVENDTSGCCVLRSCNARVPIPNGANRANEVLIHPCGSGDCFADFSLQTQSCVESCLVPAHYVPDEVSESCVLKECAARVLNISTSFPCGSNDCFYSGVTETKSGAGSGSTETGRECVTSCPVDNFHAGRSENGTCMLKDCSERTVMTVNTNDSNAYPCGTSDCLSDVAVGSSGSNDDARVCHSACADAENYRTVVDAGVCVQMSCSELAAKAVCSGRSDCHYIGSNGTCEVATAYAKRKKMITILALVGGIVILVVVAVVGIVIGVKVVRWKRGKKGEEEENEGNGNDGVSQMAETEAETERQMPYQRLDEGRNRDEGERRLLQQEQAPSHAPDLYHNNPYEIKIAGDEQVIYPPETILPVRRAGGSGSGSSRGWQYTTQFQEGCGYGSGTGGYAAGNAGGYATGNASGYAAGNASGYAAGNAGGYAAGNAGGYAAGNAGGYAAGNANGYAAGNAGGYAAGNASGYAAGNAGGYAAGNAGGYAAGNAGGYAAGNAGGYAAGSVGRGGEAINNTQQSSQYMYYPPNPHSPSTSPSSSSYGPTPSLSLGSQPPFPLSQGQGQGQGPPYPTQGYVIQGYTFISTLGRGSYGEVWKAEKNGHYYAIKSMFENDVSSDVEISFADEEKKRRLKSPFLVEYHGTFKDPNFPGKIFLVMEFCEQGDLRTLLKHLNKQKGFVLSPERLMKIFIQLLFGLQKLHENKILHRDLKPDNVLINSNDDIKISDFGCGRTFDDIDTVMATTNVGTIAYMAPEILKDDKYNTKVDIWSLGVVMYELCMLELPFKSKFQLAAVIIKGDYKPIPPESYSEQIIEIVNSMLTPDPKNRPSAQELLNNPTVLKFMDILNLRKYFN